MHGNLRWRHYLGIRGAWQPQVEALFGDKRCMATSGGGIICMGIRATSSGCIKRCMMVTSRGGIIGIRGA